MTDQQEQARPRALSPSLSRGIAVVLAAVCALALVAVVVMLVTVRPDHARASELATARGQATSVAEQFAAQVNNYDSSSIDDYQQRVSGLLTTKFAGEFEKAMGDIVQSVNEADMTSKGEVLTSAVASIDTDSADVLVVADASVKTVFDTRQRHFRWEVSLVKVDGDWLVDNFTPVT